MALCLAVLVSAAPASAEITDLRPCVTKVRAGDSLPELLSDTARFDCNPTQSHHEAGDYWVKMEVPAESQAQDMRPVLRIASLWDEGFTLTAIHTEGSVTEYGPDKLARRSAMRLGPSIGIALETNKPPIRLLIAKVKGSQIIRGVLLAPQISEPGEAVEAEMALGALYAGFGGLCLAMLVYTLALWRAMRQRFLLAYCAMVTVMATYAFFTTGAIHYVVDGMTGGDRLRITISLLAFSASTALIFVRHFFASTVIPRWLVRATYTQAAAMSGFAVLYSLLAPNFIDVLDQIYMLGFVPIPFLMIAYAYTAWKQGDPFLKYFLIAWSAPILSAIARFLHGFGVLPYHMLIENSTLLAFAFEALVNSLAVGRRVWLLAQARDHAKNAEAVARQMADTDSLTGLLNRRAFLRTILHHPDHWTLVLLDVDHFKRVNDSLGHAGGDDAITSIASVMLANAPDGSLVARIGGEEFAIGYLSHSVDVFAAEQLLADVRAINLPEGYRITASVGIADRFVNDDEDWKILYRAADMALYQAKSGGRDRFFSHLAERAAA